MLQLCQESSHKEKVWLIKTTWNSSFVQQASLNHEGFSSVAITPGPGCSIHTWRGRLGMTHVTPKPTRSRLVKMKALVALTIFWICFPGRRGWPGSLHSNTPQSSGCCSFFLSFFSSFCVFAITSWCFCRSRPRTPSASSPWRSRSQERWPDTAAGAHQRWRCRRSLRNRRCRVRRMAHFTAVLNKKGWIYCMF